MSIITAQIKKLPSSPGVYFFRDEKGELLYIGKATNLRSRVSSYFRGDVVAGRSEWICLMVALVADINFEQTDSVLEALILESNLIKKYQPKYNTLEKDDKSFAYFVVTKEEFPRVIILRQTDLFQISNFKFQISNQFQIKNKKLGKENFKYKDILIGKYYGPYTSKLQMQIALKIIRRIFPFHAGNQKTEKGCLDFQLGMCPGPYADAISKIDYKKNIHGIEMILQGKKKSLILKMEKEMQLFAKKDEFEKAAVLRNKIHALNHIRDVALMTRDFESNTQNTKYKIQNIRLESYDISNISGQHAVGSMVVFAGGMADKSQYRKFKIKTVDGSNDVAMMKEVLSRRFNNDWVMPDLILLDGGLGHLNMADELLHKNLGLAVFVASVAKGPTRKKLDVRILKSTKDENINNVLKDDLLLKQIMDEAHRFAITYHKKLRKNNFLK